MVVEEKRAGLVLAVMEKMRARSGSVESAKRG